MNAGQKRTKRITDFLPKAGTAVLLFFVLFCHQAQAFEALHEGQVRTHIQDFNLENASLGQLKGKYQIQSKVAIYSPGPVSFVERSGRDEESGSEYTNHMLQFHSDKDWILNSIQLIAMDDLGHPSKVLKEMNCDENQSVGLLPEKVPGLSNSVLVLNKSCHFQAVSYTDPRGKHLMFSFEAHMTTYLVLDAQNQVQGFYADDGDALLGKLFFLEGPLYQRDDNYTLMSLTKSQQGSTQDCGQPGQVIDWGIFPLATGPGLVEKEYCYPLIQGGFQRMIYPTHNRAHDPFTMKAVELILNSPGVATHAVLAKHPLFPVDRLSEYNCHGYALRAALAEQESHLPGDATWLEGGIFRRDLHLPQEQEGTLNASSMASSFGTYPFQTVLLDRFQEVAEMFPGGYGGIDPLDEKFLQDARLRPGDLITFIEGNQYLHTGVLISRPGQVGLWIQSKIGEGPIVDSPLLNLLNVYRALKLEVYRLKTSP
jgi:hypothetical protein